MVKRWQAPPRSQIVNITSAHFECSAPDLAACPDESLPEFAFIGRSNVGKSSLVNLLCGRPGLAKVSAVPGFTKLINFFRMDDRWRLVDLPGYGFAEVARKDSARFNQAVADYLQFRPNLRCIFVLIDSSLPPQGIDLEFMEGIARNGVPFVIAFTKVDRVSTTKLRSHSTAFLEAVRGLFDRAPETVACSAVASRGRMELLSVISRFLGEEARRRGGATPAAKRPPSAKNRPW